MDDIPEEIRGEACHLKVIAGRTSKGTEGAVSNDLVGPIYWDIHLASGAQRLAIKYPRVIMHSSMLLRES